jgi:hypothetical protein
MHSITGQQNGCRYMPVKGNEGKIYPGAGIIKTLDQAYVKRAEPDAAAVTIGVYCGIFEIDTTNMTDGQVSIEVRDGIFTKFDSSAVADNIITNAHEGRIVYWQNDNTLSLTDQSGTLCQAGRVHLVSDDGIELRIEAEDV